MEKMTFIVIRILFLAVSFGLLLKRRKPAEGDPDRTVIKSVAVLIASLVISVLMDYSVFVVNLDEFSISYFLYASVLCVLDVIITYVAVFIVARILGFRHKCYVPDISLAIACVLSFCYEYMTLRSIARGWVSNGFFNAFIYGTHSTVLTEFFQILKSVPALILAISFIVNENRADKKRSQE